MNKEFIIVNGIFAVFFVTYVITCGITYKRRVKRNVGLPLTRFPLTPQIAPWLSMILGFTMRNYFPNKPFLWYAVAIVTSLLVILWVYKVPEIPEENE